MRGRILVVDDDQGLCEAIAASLKLHDFDVTWHTGGEKAFATLPDSEFDVVLADLRMPGMNGIELCDRIVTNRPDIPVIVMTAFGSLDSAVEAMQVGAYDFVTKPIDMDVLALTLDRAVRHRGLRKKVESLSEVVEQSKRFDELMGASPAMQEVFSQISRVAMTDVKVLITGESGTGKELVARALHKRGPRSGKPFVAVNCSAVPESLLESELFGHARGAFTDAKNDRVGLFQQAEGGTLLLDEIGDLSLTLQPKLLRALEEGTIRPVGTNNDIPIDVRLITATNKDLESAADENRFRQDLFFRINVIQISLPPLRSRGTDVLLLAQHFVKQFATRFGKSVERISPNTAEKVLKYDWPGNVRELRNAMERAVALTQFKEICVEDLPEKVRDYHASSIVLESNDPGELLPLEEVERRYILYVLRTLGGNKTLAARTLGLDRKTLYRRLEGFGDTDFPPSQ